MTMAHTYLLETSAIALKVILLPYVISLSEVDACSLPDGPSVWYHGEKVGQIISLSKLVIQFNDHLYLNGRVVRKRGYTDGTARVKSAVLPEDIYEDI